MKPIQISRLLEKDHAECLSLFWSASERNIKSKNISQFIDEICEQLTTDQDKESLILKLKKTTKEIESIVHNHSKDSFAFFISDDMSGFIRLNLLSESFFIVSHKFYTRPVIEEIFENPEFLIVNLSIYDVNVYKGDFKYLEIINQYDFEELNRKPNQLSGSRLFAPKYLGAVPFKTILHIKDIAQKVSDSTYYNNIPVIVTGLSELKSLFMNFLPHRVGFFSQFNDDFYEKSCREILDKSKEYQNTVLDFYSSKLKEKFLKLQKSKTIISDLNEIIKNMKNKEITQLVIPRETKVWGEVCFEKLSYSLHYNDKNKKSVDIISVLVEKALEDEVKITTLESHYFPPGSVVMAIKKHQGINYERNI